MGKMHCTCGSNNVQLIKTETPTETIVHGAKCMACGSTYQKKPPMVITWGKGEK